MSKVLSTTVAIIGLSVGPALATNYHDYHAWSRRSNAVLGDSHPGYAGSVSLDWRKHSSMRPAARKH